MPESYRFPIMMIVSVIVLAGIIWFAARRDNKAPNFLAVIIISLIISVGGMTFAKFGANWGMSWMIYYGVPAALTVLLPILFFRMNPQRAILYLILASISAPIIHYAFSFFLGWNEYMPFLSP